jgi:CubicO group peptidase (beta-lactamase class C family)
MKAVAALLALLTVPFLTTFVAAEPLPVAKPEQVGMSSQRLERVTQVFKAQIAKERFPGSVVLIARRGKIVYFEALGQRDPGAGAPMSKEAIFRLYSMTKPMASVAAMMLVEDGKLTIADPVSKFFPQLENLQVAIPTQSADGKTTYALVPAERPMTVQDLLRHTSGLVFQHAEPAREGSLCRERRRLA